MGGVTKGAWIFWIFCAVAVFLFKFSNSEPGGASDLRTPADATSNSGTKVCRWTYHVKGSVDIKDKATMKPLATIDEGKVCPDGVSFKSCTACVNETSHINISCQITGNDLPEFLLEYDGTGVHGETGVPHFRGCAEPETATPERAKPETATPAKLKEAKPGRNRWWAILASVVVVGLFIIWLWIQHPDYFSLCNQCRNRQSSGGKLDRSQSTNGHTNGTTNGKKQANGMAEEVV